MLNDVSGSLSNNLNNNLSASLLGTNQSNSVSAVSNALKNAYGTNKTADLVDQGQISDEAIKKYEAEKEIAHYKNMLVQIMGEEEPKTDNISNLIGKVKEGNYNISDADLAQAMMADNDLVKMLF